MKHDKLFKHPEPKLENVQNKEASSHISDTNEKVPVQQDLWEEIAGISDTEETVHSDDASEIHFYKMMAEAAKFLKESKIVQEPLPRLRQGEKSSIEDIDI